MIPRIVQGPVYFSIPLYITEFENRFKKLAAAAPVTSEKQGSSYAVSYGKINYC